jgi:hypothetical protein
MGLLAPSILLAIISNPPNIGGLNTNGSDTSKIQTLPKKAALDPWRLLDKLITTAHAQEPPVHTKGPPVPEWTNEGKVVTLSKASVTPSFWDGVRAALGRATRPNPSLWVVGKTSDLATAESTAKDVNNWIVKTHTPLSHDGQPEKGWDLSPLIIHPEGTDMFYVILGGFLSPGEARGVEESIKKAAAETLDKPSTPQEKSAASVAIKGGIVQAGALFNSPAS